MGWLRLSGLTKIACLERRLTGANQEFHIPWSENKVEPPLGPMGNDQISPLRPATLTVSAWAARCHNVVRSFLFNLKV